MARGRMVNKKISNSRRVNDLPVGAALLFTWLIPHLDVNGVFYGDPTMVKSLVLPRQKCDSGHVSKWLAAMEKAVKEDGTPLIVRFQHDGDTYLYMPGFKGEQAGLRIDRERAEFPLPPTIPPTSREKPADVPQTSVISQVKSSQVNRSSTEQNSRAREKSSEREQKALTSAVEVEQNLPPQVTDFKNISDVTDLTRLTDYLTTLLKDSLTRGPLHAMPVLKKLWVQGVDEPMGQKVYDVLYMAFQKYPVDVIARSFTKAVKYKGGSHDKAKYLAKILEEKGTKDFTSAAPRAAPDTGAATAEPP